MFGSGLRMAMSKGVIFKPWVVFGSGLHVAVSKRSNFWPRVVFVSGLHVVVSKSCNFQASGCILVGLTRCGVEKLYSLRSKIDDSTLY